MHRLNVRLRALVLLSALLVVAIAMVSNQAGATLVGTSTPPTFTWEQDENGADDQPGQKDLNEHAVKLRAPGDLWVAWKWDDTGLSGGNTGDACALFDNNLNSRVNFAICVTIEKNPAQQALASPRVYTCGDGKVDRCTSTYAQVSSIGTVCTTTTLASDVFHGTSKKDTQAICHVDLADVTGSGTPDLVNTCSYPSQQPTSAPSDCVRIPRDAFLRVTKVAPGGSTTSFPFRLWAAGTTAPAVGSPTMSVNGDSVPGTYVPIRSDVTYTLKEDVPANWQIDPSTAPVCAGASGSAGTASGDTISGIDANADDLITCTYTDRQQAGAIKITKQRSNTTIKLAGAIFRIDGGTTNYTTDSNGEVCIGGLSLGNHTVLEYQAPNGHDVASPASQIINVQNAGTCTTGATAATFNDPVVPGTINIHKTGIGGAALQGVTFTLWTNVAPLTGDHNGDGDTVTAKSCSTDASGDCSITAVALGDYWIVETVPNGYTGAGDQAVTIGVGTAPGTGQTKSFNITNSAAPGSIVINKMDAGGAPLKDAVFQLYYDVGFNANDTNAILGLEDTAVPGVTCTSAANGECLFTGVAPGHYWLRETTAPNGYDLAADTQVYVGIGGSAGTGATATVNITDPVTPGTVRITKRDDDGSVGNLVGGAEFTLYRDVSPVGGSRNQTNTDPITDPVKKCTTGAAGTTDAGKCDITGVAPGKYWVVETGTPTHYETAADQAITVGIGTAPQTGASVPVAVVDPRKHRVVVLVCHEGTDTLSSRDVTVGGVTKQSVGAGSLSQAQQKALCDTGGASYGDISGHGAVSASVALAGTH